MRVLGNVLVEFFDHMPSQFCFRPWETVWNSSKASLLESLLQLWLHHTISGPLSDTFLSAFHCSSFICKLGLTIGFTSQVWGRKHRKPHCYSYCCILLVPINFQYFKESRFQHVRKTKGHVNYTQRGNTPSFSQEGSPQKAACPKNPL